MSFLDEPLGSLEKIQRWSLNLRKFNHGRYVPYIRRFVSRAEAFGEEARITMVGHGIVCNSTGGCECGIQK